MESPRGAAQERQQELAALEDEESSGDGLTEDHASGSEEAEVQQKDGPPHQDAEDGLAQARAGDFRDVAAAFQEGEERIDLEGEAGSDNDEDPGKDEVDVAAAGLFRRVAEKADADGDERDRHGNGGEGVPADSFLQQRSEARV